jgi:glycosyltransferase involved in cell wall biosynthesis
MISFIIIGKNSAQTLKLAINSVIIAIKENKIIETEIIYVDSHSQDSSIDIAKSFEGIKIYSIIGDANAAVGRNIGAKESEGDLLCFLDGDMEIDPEFIATVIQNDKLIYPFVSGQLLNIYYTKNWEYKAQSFKYPNLKEYEYSPQTGGFFIIEKEIWVSVSGMNTKYRRCQDIDFALRLAKRGILLLRKKELFAKHHTVNYFDKSRRWAMLFDGSFLYQTSVLYRDHFFNKHILKVILRNSYSFIILLLSISLVTIDWYLIFLYPLAIFFRVLGQFFHSKQRNLFVRYFYFIVLDIFILIGLFTFFPQEKSLNYQSV